MATATELVKWRKGLRSGIPLIGGIQRRSAVGKLEAHRNESEVVPLLVEALDCTDPKARARALSALKNLASASAVDALCAVWFKSRDERLGEILVEKDYVAGQPNELRVLTALKSNHGVDTADGKAVPILAQLLADPDAVVAGNAEKTLRSLQPGAAQDALCAVWAKHRQKATGQMIVDCRYVATAPPEVRMLTTLKTAGRAPAKTAEDARLLVQYLADADPAVQAAARTSLSELRPGAAQDALCEMAIQDPAGDMAKMCLGKEYRPVDHERACLFLFVTRQLDAYFKEDFEFQNLRLQYDRADERIRSHVMDVVRSGDRRCQPFAVRPRKALGECNDREIKLAIESCLRHKDWDRLFTACLELPLKYSFPLLERFRESGWEPQAPELKSLYRQILADSKGTPIPEPQSPKSTSSVFERWLARGRDAEFAKAGEADLLNRLKSATPPEGVTLVAGLAAKGGASDAAHRAVAENEHWLIRLAGLATGLTRDLITDKQNDPNYWVTELSGAAGVLEFWPGKGAPADLERLGAAPPEAFAGKLGAARKILRNVLGHRVTTPDIGEMIIVADETSAEFATADDDDGEKQ